MTTRADRAAAAAAREVAELLGLEHQRAAFKVEKFGVHADGYLHARISLNGERFYVHRRYGSWQMPGHIGGHAAHREVLYPFNAALQEYAAPFDRKRREEREARDAASKPANPGGDSQTVPPDRVPEGGDRTDAP